MKLLIVDDEQITREGIIQSIPFINLGIDEINQADDGINGLTIAESFRPDIILSDVRMPRMDGIQMSIQLKKLYPNCKLIFMSGYSDREYLKSAIQLKVIDYVDKPIRINELTLAINNAVASLSEDNLKEDIINVAGTSMRVGLSLLRSELALMLSSNAINIEMVNKQAKIAEVNLPQNGFFNTIVVKFISLEKQTPGNMSQAKTSISDFFEIGYRKYKISGLSVLRNDDFLIIHLFIPCTEKQLLSEDKLFEFVSYLSSFLKGLGHYIISIGKLVQGVEHINISYDTALGGIDKSFFKGYDSILLYSQTSKTSISQYRFQEAIGRNFTKLINDQKWDETIFYIKSLTCDLKCYESTPINSIKNLYYSLLVELSKLSHQKGFSLFDNSMSENCLWGVFLEFDVLSQMEEYMLDKLSIFIEYCSEKNINSNLVNKVCKYIEDHYKDDSLSINKISEHAHFAPTYICSIFKKNTNKTLNQYITEYRVEKSKVLLEDLKYNISDIAIMIGCVDSGYFTKIFKKVTGITPSKYREYYIL